MNSPDDSAPKETPPSTSDRDVVLVNENGKRAIDEGTTGTAQQPNKKKRFETSYAEEAEWDLPEDMAEYFKKQMNNFIKPSDIADRITTNCPPPRNLDKVPILDESFKELLFEAGKKAVIEQDEILFNIQKRVWDVLGPFCSIWSNMELDKDRIDQDEKAPEEVIEGAKAASTSFEQTVTLIGQLVNHILYQRRFSILSAMFNDKKKAKLLLKDWKDLLVDNENYLFGGKFEDKVVKTQKTKLKTKQLLKDSVPSKSPRFPRGPHPQRPRGRGRSGYSWSFRNFCSYQGNQSSSNNPSNGNDGFSNRGRGKNLKISPVSNGFNRELSPCSSSFEKPFWGFHTSGFGISRQAEVLLKKLGEGDKRPNHSRPYPGLQNTLCSLGKPRPEGTSLSFENEQGGGVDCRPGGRESIGERSHRRDNSISRSGFEHSFYGEEKRQGLSTSDKLKISQLSHSLLPLQNGRFAFAKRSVMSGGFHDQIGFEGCLLLCGVRGTVQKICQVQMERQAIPVPLYVFRSWSGTQVIHQTDEGSYNYSEKAECSVNCLSGRYISYGEFSGRDSNGKRLLDISVTGSGFRHKHSKISSRTVPRVRVFRGDSEFGENGVDFTIRQNRKDCQSVRADSVTNESESDGSYQTSWEVNIIGDSSVGSTTALQEDSKMPDKRADERFLPVRDKSVRRGETRVGMVEGESKIIKWEVSVNEESGHSNVNGRIQGRLGCRLPGETYRGAMENEREGTAYKHFRIEGSSVSNKNIHTSPLKGTIYPSSDGQHNSSFLHSENGGHSEQDVARIESGALELFTVQGDHNYCGIPPWNSQQDSRLGVKKCQGLQRMETEQRNFQTDHKEFRLPTDRSFCLSGVAPTSSVRFVETGPMVLRGGCLSNVLGKSSDVCISPVLSDRSGTKQGNSGASRTDSSNSSVARSVMVPKTVANVCPETITDPSVSNPIDQPSRGEPPSNARRHTNSSGLADFRKTLEAEGISNNAANLISNARRKSSISHYESAWGKWSSWTRQRKIDPVSCSLNFILDFLAELFDKGLQYNTICTYRSAISAYHNPVEGKPVGQNSRISALMTGVFNLRPPLPRYTFVWDVSEVLSFIRRLPTDNSISNKDLTLKLSSLLAITSAGRASEICYFDIRYLVKGKSSYEFHFSKLTKSWRRGKPRPKMSFNFFPEEPSICVCKTIDQYLLRSKEWRSEEDTQLLLSHIKPHDPVEVGTVSRWLMEMLRQAGIDTSTFTGHSTRYASTSKAKAVGIPLQEIVKRGQWSSDLMFKTRYCQDVQERSMSSYDKVLLKGALNKVARSDGF